MQTDLVLKKWKFKAIAQARATRAGISPELAGKIEKIPPLREPIRLQDSQNFVRSSIEKRVNVVI